MKTFNVLMETCEITKTGTLVPTFEKPIEESYTYLRFGYDPLKIYNHNCGQVTGSMNADSINMIHRSQQSTHDVLNKLFEGDKNLYWFT